MRYIYFVLITFCVVLHFQIGSEEPSKDEKEEVKPIKAGNFKLPTSQQPGPLIGFGQNIIEKGQIQVFIFADEYKRSNGYMIDVIPSILYAITDSFSVYFNVPIAPRYKLDGHHSSGLEDIFLQFEYAFFNETTLFSSCQATVVGNVAFPTGSPKKNPNTGFGAPSFFIGSTFNYTTIDWFFFCSGGALFTTYYHDTRFGDEYFYELGFGGNISSPPEWIYAWMVEIDGFASSRNIKEGSIDRNSGGNVIYITPSIWISSEHIIVQIGAGGILQQHLYGHQPKYTYQLIGNLGYTF